MSNNNIKYLLLLALASVIGLSACVDEKLDYGMDYYDPSQDPEMVCLPFNLCYDFTVSTRDGEADNDDSQGSEQEEDNTNKFPGFADGTEKEHKIDFDQDKECFAIFFGPNENDELKLKYMKRLYISDQLGAGKKEKGGYTEYSVPVICYIPKSDCIPHYAADVKDEDKATATPEYWEPKLLNVLVVLNGGKIYQQIHNELYDSDVVKDLTINDVLKLEWENPADYSQAPYNKDKSADPGEIGKNKNGNFTMTSSAYWEEDNATNKYKLMTATPITGKAYDSLKKYIESEDEPTATVYVERMVAKFSAPTFATAVIGSRRVFRPDQNAMTLVVYSWKDNLPQSEPKNWRIHLVGWAINGTESSSYIFKNIGNVEYGNLDGIDPNIIENDKYRDWNKPGEKRSYWSVDPHYNSSLDDFYPWQFRKAADKSYPISVEAGLQGKGGGEGKEPVLRYKTFNDLKEVTEWQPLRYVHENTYNPEGEWNKRFNDEATDKPDDQREQNEMYLDGRANLLAGPHLLIGGELYLEGAGDVYQSSGLSFGTVPNIYSDRLRRFYMTELDWFKMFFYELNNTLETQEKMSFTSYDWDEESNVKLNEQLIAEPEGKPRLFFDGEELTMDKIDQLWEEAKNDPSIKFSQRANIRNGDGRLIPWLQMEKHLDNGNHELVTLKIRLTEDGRERKNDKGETIMDSNNKPLKRVAGQEMFYTKDGSNNLLGNWDEDMYKSFFYEWFGPIDHYSNGYMYYAGPITHHRVFNNTDFFGTVRNHWYTFHVQSINSLGVPVDDPNQIIIPGNFNYNDQIVVYMDVLGWHTRPTTVDIP